MAYSEDFSLLLYSSDSLLNEKISYQPSGDNFGPRQLFVIQLPALEPFGPRQRKSGRNTNPSYLICIST